MNKFFKSYKEEIVFIPLILGLLFLVKAAMSWFSPESAQFDLASEWETIVWTIVKGVVYLTVTWLAMRVVFPNGFKYLKREIYHKFDEFDEQTKGTVSLLWYFAILFVFVLLSGCTPEPISTVLPIEKELTLTAEEPAEVTEVQLRTELVELVKSQIGIKEATGNNDGIHIDRYAEPFGFAGKKLPWCAMFTSYQYNQLDIKNPNSAWSPHWAKKKDIIWKPKTGGTHPQPGDAFTLYYNKLKRVGHVGIIVSVQDNYFVTVEGNTNSGKSREGQGVYSHKRAKNKVYAVTNYITPSFNEKHNHSNSTGTLIFLQNTKVYGPAKGNEYNRATGNNIRRAGHDYTAGRKRNIISNRSTSTNWNHHPGNYKTSRAFIAQSKSRGWKNTCESNSRQLSAKDYTQRETRNRNNRNPHFTNRAIQATVYTRLG